MLFVLARLHRPATTPKSGVLYDRPQNSMWTGMCCVDGTSWWRFGPGGSVISGMLRGYALGDFLGGYM